MQTTEWNHDLIISTPNIKDVLLEEIRELCDRDFDIGVFAEEILKFSEQIVEFLRRLELDRLHCFGVVRMGIIKWILKRQDELSKLGDSKELSISRTDVKNLVMCGPLL